MTRRGRLAPGRQRAINVAAKRENGQIRKIALKEIPNLTLKITNERTRALDRLMLYM